MERGREGGGSLPLALAAKHIFAKSFSPKNSRKTPNKLQTIIQCLRLPLPPLRGNFNVPEFCFTKLLAQGKLYL